MKSNDRKIRSFVITFTITVFLIILCIAYFCCDYSEFYRVKNTEIYNDSWNFISVMNWDFRRQFLARKKGKRRKNLVQLPWRIWVKRWSKNCGRSKLSMAPQKCRKHLRAGWHLCRNKIWEQISRMIFKLLYVTYRFASAIFLRKVVGNKNCHKRPQIKAHVHVTYFWGAPIDNQSSLCK